MPRYFFHIDDGAFLPDDSGTEFADLDAVRAEAVRAAGDMLVDLDGNFCGSGTAWTMYVTDDLRRLLFTLQFSAKVPAGAILFAPADDQKSARD